MVERDFRIITIDSSNPNWADDEQYMFYWLHNLERYLNDTIKNRGMLCVNDVRVKLGVKPIVPGYFYGWTKPIIDIFDVFRAEDCVHIGLLGAHDFRDDATESSY